MANRVEYQIVGRYMAGKEVTGYHLQSIETGKAGKYTRDQVAFLVGRGQITNCTAQIYKDKVLLRGKGMSLDDLPVQYENGNIKNAEQLGKVKKGDTSIMEKFLIVGVIKSGRNVAGYVLQNAGCGIKKVRRSQVLELARQHKIGNAEYKTYQGKPFLRGIGCKLDELPVEQIGGAETQEPQPTQPTQPTQPKKKAVNTVKVIRLNQFYYDKYKNKIDLSVVDFEVYNPDLDKNALTRELQKFIKEVKEKTTHEFCNTDDIIETELASRQGLGTFDYANYTNTKEYLQITKRLGAKLVINGNADIYYCDGNELSQSEKLNAYKVLEESVKKLKQDGGNTVMYLSRTKTKAQV